ncbi:MAG: HAMP domain-containing protein, partial [Pseudomonadota bacterium]
MLRKNNGSGGTVLPLQKTPSHRVIRGVPNRVLFIALAGIGSLIFVITAYALTNYVEAAPRYVSVLFTLVVLATISLCVLVLASLLDLYKSAKAGLRGARLHRRLVGLLTIIAIVPGVLAFTLTITVLRSFSDEYFVERVSEADLVAKNFANSYLDAESRKMGLQVVQLATDLGLQAQSGLSLQTAPIGFRRYLLGQTILRGFSSVVLMDDQGQILAEVTPMEGREYRLPPRQDFEAVSRPGASPFKFSAHDQSKFDAWYSILKLNGPGKGYLIAYQAENPTLSNELLSVRELRDQSKDLRDRLSDLTQVFAVGYGLVMLLLLLIAVWVGLLVANTIVGPVRRLATAAVAVSDGDLSSRVEVKKGDGELGDLGHAFNDMTEQLEAQRGDLVAANEQSDARRRFIETVIAGVPAGVLNISPEGRIALSNPSADRILGQERGQSAGRYIADIAPTLLPLIKKAKKGSANVVRDQIELKPGGRERIINVRISPDDPQRQSGFVVTLDDITELVGAQRNAAWGDVARRIAHEIKNPLTPIQLSAERLKRKYGNKMGEDREIFDRCTDTIIRHVGDIGRMVNEFSSFARMPKPNKSQENLTEVVRSASFSFSMANPTLIFE